MSTETLQVGSWWIACLCSVRKATSWLKSKGHSVANEGFNPDDGLKTSNGKKVHQTCHDIFDQFLGSSDLTNGLTGEPNAIYGDELLPFRLALFWGCDLVLLQSSAISCYHPRRRTWNINIYDSLNRLLFYQDGAPPQEVVVLNSVGQHTSKTESLTQLTKDLSYFIQSVRAANGLVSSFQSRAPWWCEKWFWLSAEEQSSL